MHCQTRIHWIARNPSGLMQFLKGKSLLVRACEDLLAPWHPWTILNVRLFFLFTILPPSLLGVLRLWAADSVRLRTKSNAFFRTFFSIFGRRDILKCWLRIMGGTGSGVGRCRVGWCHAVTPRLMSLLPVEGIVGPRKLGPKISRPLHSQRITSSVPFPCPWWSVPVADHFFPWAYHGSLVSIEYRHNLYLYAKKKLKWFEVLIMILEVIKVGIIGIWISPIYFTSYFSL